MLHVRRSVLFFSAVTAALACVFAVQSVVQEASSAPAGAGVPGDQPSGLAVAGEPGEFVPHRLLVGLEDQAFEGVLKTLNNENGARIVERLAGTDVRVVSLPERLGVEEAIPIYEAVPGIAYAEPDYLIEPARLTPDDTYFAQMHGLDNTGQTGGTPDADIDAPEAWGAASGVARVPVAVIDSGTDIEHPDLRDNVWTNADEVPDNGVDDDGNGYVDDVHGWDFYNNDASVYDPADGDRHGTHVSGTIGASGNNGLGVAGVSWEAEILPLKFLGPDGGQLSDAVKALNYALAEGVDISNNSWTGGYYSEAMVDALRRANEAGHLFVVAAGNSGVNTNEQPVMPLEYDSPNMLVVAATDATDSLAWYSNYGSRKVDVAAPGSLIWSTTPREGYGVDTGTSMATPHVSGTAALLKGLNPQYDAARLKAQILQSGDRLAALQDKVVTGSRLNAHAAVTFAGPLELTRPTITPVSPKPSAQIKNRTPTIRAVVEDDRTDLAADDLTLELDGSSTAFQYDRATNTLSHTVNSRLTYGVHRVRITATDDDGNVTARTWSFKVIR